MVKRSRMTRWKTLLTWALVMLFAFSDLTTPAIALNALVQAGPGEPSTANPAAPDPNPENPGSQDPKDPVDPQDPDDKKDPIPATVEHLTAQVTLKNHGLTQGQFSFVLKDDKGQTVASGTNDASGKVVLSSFEIAQAGTYTYELSQTGKAASGYTLDTQKFTVVLTVSLSEDKASLVAKVTSPSTPMTFANSYLAPNRGWQGSGSSRTFVQDDGSLIKSCVAKIGDNHYLFDGSGKLEANGWKTFQNRRYHATAQGELTSGWFLDGSWYYLDPAENCAMATGWKVVDGAHYYLDMSGHMLSSGWKWLGGSWYYLHGSGAAATGWLLNGSWYYLDPASAAMRTGWQKIDNAWYYLDGSGAMRANGWMRLGNTWYYLYASGAMASGWQWVGGAWYYLGGPDDGAMKTGWFQDGDYWYYCDGSGAMAHNEWIGSWWVNGSGAWDPSLPASGKTGWQNPSNYYQVSSYGVRFPGAGHGYYVTVPTIRADATREQCISAFLARARNYLGTPYRWNYSDAPGVGVDCIGLVYQCAYATGMDLGEFNPYNHWITGPHGWHSHDANNFWSYGKIQKIAFECRAPGDLIFWPGHVAIYIGNDQVIEAVPGRVRQASIRASGANYLGVGRLYV